MGSRRERVSASAAELTGPGPWTIGPVRGESERAGGSDRLVGGQARVRRMRGQVGLREQLIEVRGEYAVEELFDVVQHEVGLLIGVDQVVRAQHALQVEPDARRAGG